jgi:hypothetical protein
MNTLDLIPGEIQVVGAKLEKPEIGIKAAIDSNELSVVRNSPGMVRSFSESAMDFLRLRLNCSSRVGYGLTASRTRRTGHSLHQKLR